MRLLREEGQRKRLLQWSQQRVRIQAMASLAQHMQTQNGVVKTTGAHAVIKTLKAFRVDVIFANPGTTEMPLIAALDDVDGAPRCILCAHETVCSGAADGYARMLGKPACTILHLGVGLANALANLHNAKRACSPVLNLVGTMAAWHVNDAPLASDARALAEWCGGCEVAVGADDCGPTVEEALLGIRDFEGGASRVTTVLLPHDAQREPLTRSARIDAMAEDDGGFQAALELYPDYVNHAKACAAALSRGGAALVIGGSGLFDEEAFAALQKLEAATGCALVVPNNFSRCDRGGTRPRFIRVPYFPAAAKAFFASFQTVVCVGCKPPVAMFGYEDHISKVVDHALELDAMDVVGALNYLAKHVVPGAPASQVPPMARGDMDETGPLTAPVLCQVLAWLQPTDAIIVDESLTTGATYWDCSLIGGLPFTHLTLDRRRHRQRPLPRGRRGRRLSASTRGQLPGRRLGALLDAGALVYE